MTALKYISFFSKSFYEVYLIHLAIQIVTTSSLWEKSCPTECVCTVEPWPYIQLDAKVMRCDNRSLDCLPKNLTAETEVLIMSNNNLGVNCHFNLWDLRYLQSLRFFDFSCNRIRVIYVHGIEFPQVRYLNLSHNAIYNLQPEVLADFPILEYLNLENNYISTLTTTMFTLPNLHYLNLGHNRIFTLKANFYFNSPKLQTLVLSHNVLTRLPGGIFFRIPRLEKLDLSYNRLSKIEDLAFDGLKSLSELKLEGNTLRQIPITALRIIPSIGQLAMDRNPIRQLGPLSFNGLNVTHISLCHSDELNVVHERTFANMPYLTSVALAFNKVLTSIAPKTFVGLSNLRMLDLRNDNLYVIEESIRSEMDRFLEDSGDTTDIPSVALSAEAPAPLPVPLTLRLNGNPLVCDCNLKWVQDILTRQYGHNITVPDGKKVKCLDRTKDAIVSLLESDDLPSQCAPFILPQFHPVIKETVTSNVSFLCHGTGLPQPTVYWVLPDGRRLDNGMCEDRACVDKRTLTIKYLHEEDSGVYECRATNVLGEFKRSLHLEVKNINVLLFPLTVTSTFVTLAWNGSGIPFTAYQLQYGLTGDTSTETPVEGTWKLQGSREKRQRKTIEVGTKVNSYTVHSLTPGETYTFWLCVKRADYAIKISTLEVTTKEEGFLLMLGIRRNYASVILIGTAAGIVFLGCTTLCCVKICRLVRQDHSELVISESGSSRCFVKSDSCNSEVAFMTYINVSDDTTLVDNEDESPQ